MEEQPKPAATHLANTEEEWIAENAKAFACWNAYVKKNGLPLAKYLGKCEEGAAPISVRRAIPNQ